MPVCSLRQQGLNLITGEMIMYESMARADGRYSVTNGDATLWPDYATRADADFAADLMTVKAANDLATREAHAGREAARLAPTEDARAEIQARYEHQTALYIWLLVMAWIAGTCLAFIVQ